MRTIEIIISPGGQTTVQTRGFSGSTCRDASRLIEQALGQVQSDVPTAEMYQAGSTQQQVRQSGR